MSLIFDVFEDLYTFARDSMSGILSNLHGGKASSPALLNAAPSRSQLPAAHETEEEEEDVLEDLPLTFKSTAEILSTTSVMSPKNTVMYTGSERVPIMRRPTMEFDGGVAYIPYGAMVMVLESRGRWSRVAYRDAQGWVLRDELVDRSAHVYPDFTIGEPNRADDPNTLRVRACIDDEFGAGRAELPLQSSEYVLYRLYKKGITVIWPDVRPRTEGMWHEILKGKEGIQIGIRACSGCIMEYVYEDGIGHLAYVEAVFPDETISISEANYPSDGVYNERVVTKEEWRELKPVFMDIK